MLQSVFLVIIAMLSIQLGASFAKQLFSELAPAGISFFRIFFASVLLFLFFRPAKLTRSQWKLLIPYGLSLGLMNLTFYWSLAKIPLGVAVAVEFTGPLVLAVLLSRRPKDFIWIGLAGLGLYLLSPLNQLQGISTLDHLGLFWALVAGFFWALYIYFGQKVSQKIPTSMAITWGMAIAALSVLPFGMVSFSWSDLNGPLLLTCLVVALLSSAIPYTLEMQALKGIPAKSFGILMSLEPVLAAVAGFAVLHEKLSGLQMLSILLIISASLGSLLSIQKGR
jgi:inner membrane transporter RhtA